MSSSKKKIFPYYELVNKKIQGFNYCSNWLTASKWIECYYEELNFLYIDYSTSLPLPKASGPCNLCISHAGHRVIHSWQFTCCFHWGMKNYFTLTCISLFPLIPESDWRCILGSAFCVNTELNTRCDAWGTRSSFCWAVCTPLPHPHLQSLQQLLPCGDVGHVDGGAEGIKHFHLLKDIFAARGPDDKKLATLIIGRKGVKTQRKELIRKSD